MKYRECKTINQYSEISVIFFKNFEAQCFLSVNYFLMNLLTLCSRKYLKFARLFCNSDYFIGAIIIQIVFDCSTGVCFCRQWHLCQFLNLRDLSTHQFGLFFPCPTSNKMRVGVHWTPSPPLVVLRLDFLELCFLKK